MSNNTPIENHPMIGVGYIYKPSEPSVEIVKPDASLVLAAGMEVRVESVFANWNGVEGRDMLYVFVPETGYHAHVTPADLNVEEPAAMTTFKATAALTLHFDTNDSSIGDAIGARIAMLDYLDSHPSTDAFDITIATERDTRIPAEPETHRLVGWGDFETIGTGYVLPRLFGHLVRLAAPVVQEYHSDLYRDAQWLPKNVTGPVELDFIVRHSGTHLGVVGADFNMARSYMEHPVNWSEGDRFYRLSLTVDERGEWSLTITEQDKSTPL